MPASVRALSLILAVLIVWPAVECRAQTQNQTRSHESAGELCDSLNQNASVDGDPVAWPAARVTARVGDDSLWAEALRIHFNAIVLDGHVDVPMHMVDEGYRLDRRHSSHRSHVDLPRMREGGLDGAVFAVYVAPYYGEGARAVARAREQIQEVRRQIEAEPGV
ncbi:MAG: hypothetical protein GVY25_00130, partial [Bacteroidetes bacterium]|nr:hypothetical protein [Bacteroidota bacterium]